MILKRYKPHHTSVPREPTEAPTDETSIRYLGISMRKKELKKILYFMQKKLDELIEEKIRKAKPLLVGDLYVNPLRFTCGARNETRRRANLAPHPDYPLSDNKMFSLLAKDRFITLYDTTKYWTKHPAIYLTRGLIKYPADKAVPHNKELHFAYKRASVMEFYRIWWAVLRDHGRWDIIKQQNDLIMRKTLCRHPFDLYIKYLADVDFLTDYIENNRLFEEHNTDRLGIPHTLHSSWLSLTRWLIASYRTAQIPWIYPLDKEKMRYIHPPTSVEDEIIIQTLYDHILSPLIPIQNLIEY